MTQAKSDCGQDDGAIYQNMAQNHELPWSTMNYYSRPWDTVFMIFDHVLLNVTMIFDYGSSLSALVNFFRKLSSAPVKANCY